ncbi:unnamed protein product [Lampetra fluviatilis]
MTAAAREERDSGGGGGVPRHHPEEGPRGNVDNDKGVVVSLRQCHTSLRPHPARSSHPADPNNGVPVARPTSQQGAGEEVDGERRRREGGRRISVT